MIKRIANLNGARDRLSRQYEPVLHRAIGVSYIIGDAFYQLASGLKSGFPETVAQGHPDWGMLQHAYGDRPLPVLGSAIFIWGSALMARGQLAKGYGITVVADGVLIWDMAAHGEPASALGMVPTFLGCLVLAWHRPLGRKFGSHRNRVVRLLLGNPVAVGATLIAWSAVPLIFTGLAEGNLATTITALFWSLGALLTACLPGRHGPADDALAKVSPF